MFIKMAWTSLPILLFNLGFVSFILGNPTSDPNTPHHSYIAPLEEMNWEISTDICKNGYCKCQYKGMIYEISCRCGDDHRQVINLMSYTDTDKQKQFPMKTRWTIEKCDHVVVQSKAFSAVNGEYFDLHLVNLSSAEIREDAFELTTLTNGNNRHTRKIRFEQVNVDQIPPKAFPSHLNLFQVIGSTIGTISSQAFVANNINQIEFHGSEVGTIEKDAFFESLLIESWLVRNSNFTNIRSKGVASSVTNMTWMDSRLDHLESFALGGVIVNASFNGNVIGLVESDGLTFKDWTWISYVNNTFGLVNYSGIDLSKHPSSNFNVTEFSGNTWIELRPEFIIASQTETLAIVRNNRLREACVCGSDIISKLLTSEANTKFQDEFRNNSLCYTTKKGAECIGHMVEGETEDEIFIPFQFWQLSCNETVDQCIHESVEVRSVYSTPSASPTRLRHLVILIGSIGIAIVICLVGVLCVYMCRRTQPSNKSSPSSSTHGELTKVLSKGSSMGYADITNNSSSSNGLNLSSRPRSTIFEDVEMEDKGVQTLPSELSTDVLEGLRAKLSHPDSFWDAKETIDHLYDLIHVRETSPLSSPPDVTMLCSSSTATGTSPPQPTAANKPIVGGNGTTSSKLTRNRQVTPRYAQIRSKLKTAPICEYGDPSDSQMHIYSELGSNPGNRQSTSTGTQAYLCEYTEPRDVQTHVYAELNSGYPPPRVPSDFQPRPTTSTPLPNQQFEFPSNSSPVVAVLSPRSPTQFQSQIFDNPCPSTPPCQQRPLPSIPSRPSLQ